MARRNWRQFDFRYGVTFSPTALEKFGACNRKWYMEKVMRLPAEEFVGGGTGDVVHALAEHWLRGNDDLRTCKEWPGPLDAVDADIVLRAVTKMVDDGALRRSPGLRVEVPVQVPVFDDRSASMFGFVDATWMDGDVLVVEDHKTSKAERWLATADQLRKDNEMLCYAYALGAKREAPPAVVRLRLNQVVLDPMLPTTRSVEVSREWTDVLKHWHDYVQPTAKKMLALKQAGGPAASVAGAAKKDKTCFQYGRECAYYDVCYRNLSTDDYAARAGRDDL